MEQLSAALAKLKGERSYRAFVAGLPRPITHMNMFRWITGRSLPDLDGCRQIARAFPVRNKRNRELHRALRSYMLGDNGHE